MPNKTSTVKDEEVAFCILDQIFLMPVYYFNGNFVITNVKSYLAHAC
jgi:hypothetical protein